MAVTQNTYTGNGSTVLYSFTFPYLETTDIKVSVNGTVTTAYTLANATTIQFNSAPANGAAIRIYRQTDDSDLSATFYPGSAIRSQDLNDNFTQNLYVTQEVNNTAVRTDGSNPMVGNLNMNGFQIDNLAAPTSDTDAVNRAYVNSIVANGIGDGDKGDVVVSGSGSTFTIDSAAITDSKVAANANIASSKLAFTQAGTGAVQRPVESKLQDVVSVKDFGAVGDGVTDDYSAFAAATTYCNDNNIHSLLIPPGNYHLSEIWGVPSGGSYVPCATIAYGAVVDNTVVVGGGAGIQGLTVDGAADCGFCFVRGQGSYHSYLVAKNCGSYGVYFGIASRQHLTVDNAAGFQVGELVTGGTSGATGTIERIEGNVIRLAKCNLGSSPKFFTTESISGSISSATATVTSSVLPLGANYQVTRATFDQVTCVSNGNKGFYWDGTATANRSWMNATCWISPSSVGNNGKGWAVGTYAGPGGSNEHNYNTFLNINCESNTDKSLDDVTGRQNTYIGGHFVDIDGSGQSVNVSDSFNFQLGGRYIGTVNFNGPFSIRNMQTGSVAGSISGLDSFRTNAFQADGPAFMPSGWSILPGSKISRTIAANNQTNHLIDVDLSDFISGNHVMFRMFIGGFRNQSGGYNDFDHAQLTGQMSSQAGSTVTHAVNYAVASAEGITVNSVSISTAGVVTFDITTAQQIFSFPIVFEYYDTDSTDAR